MDMDKVRRGIRSKAFNVLERVDQLDDCTQKEIDHLDAAIKYLAKEWDENKLLIFADRHSGNDAPR